MLTILVNQVNLGRNLFRVNNFLVNHFGFSAPHRSIESDIEIAVPDDENRVLKMDKSTAPTCVT